MSEETPEVVQYSYDLDGQSQLTAEVHSSTYDLRGQRGTQKGTHLFSLAGGRE